MSMYQLRLAVTLVLAFACFLELTSAGKSVDIVRQTKKIKNWSALYTIHTNAKHDYLEDAAANYLRYNYRLKSTKRSKFDSAYKSNFISPCLKLSKLLNDNADQLPVNQGSEQVNDARNVEADCKRLIDGSFQEKVHQTYLPLLN